MAAGADAAGLCLAGGANSQLKIKQTKGAIFFAVTLCLFVYGLFGVCVGLCGFSVYVSVCCCVFVRNLSMCVCACVATLPVYILNGSHRVDEDGGVYIYAFVQHVVCTLETRDIPIQDAEF